MWPAPAKINLMLRILGQRSDGYHSLQTVFQFIDWCDYLSFDVLQESIVCREAGDYGVDEEQDLVVKAARLLQVHGNVSQGVRIFVDKNLPMGAGLGGGSSDAATTLVALNVLWGVDFSLIELAELGLQLGADVPVFVQGMAAWAEGVGEQIKPMDLPACYYLMILPDCHVSTAQVFANSQLTRDSKAITIRAFLDGDQQNDCLSVVRKHYPAVNLSIEILAKYADARMTGTGSTVYAVFETEVAALQVFGQLPGKLDKRIVKGLNVSPLLSKLSQN